MKKITWIFTAACIFFGTVTSAVKAESYSDRTKQCGLIPTEEIEIAQKDLDPVFEDDITAENYALHRAQTYSNELESYGSYYIYNLLTEEERAYWEALNEMCLFFMNTQTDALSSTSNGKDVFYLSGATSETMTKDEMKRIFSLFKYANPQYYFINHQVISFTRDGKVYVSPGIYSAFADGADRMAVTEEFLAQADKWQEQIILCETEEEKVRLIHDLITEKVTYNNRIYNSNFDENTEYSQSAYSVLCMDTTVCAGYAQAFEMLCNRVGIDSFAVTSKTHEWNKVRINDSWYNVDCTWDDSGDAVTYRYFERSDNYYDNTSTSSFTSHKEEELWETYLPVCTLDAFWENEEYSSPGCLPVITEQTPAPQIAITPFQGMAQVTISGTGENTEVYYTLDGTAPSCAFTKSLRYREQFVVPWQTTISVIAAKDAHWDSEIVTRTAVCEHQYVWKVTKEASCTQEGQRANVCEYCGDILQTDIIAASGHIWDDGVIADGILTHTCIRCFATWTETAAGSESVGGTPDTDGAQNTQPGNAAEETDKDNTQSTQPGTAGAEQPAGTESAGGLQNTDTENTQGNEKKQQEPPKKAKKGDLITVGKNTYQVTKTGTNSQVRFVKTKKDTKALVIPAQITSNGVRYKVTAVYKEACKNHKNIKSVDIGKNVTSIGAGAFYKCTALKKVTIQKGVTQIGKNAFYGCRQLSAITIKSTVLKKVGSNALKGIKKTAKIKVPSAKKTKYQKLFSKKGQSSTVKFVK